MKVVDGYLNYLQEIDPVTGTMAIGWLLMLFMINAVEKDRKKVFARCLKLKGEEKRRCGWEVEVEYTAKQIQILRSKRNVECKKEKTEKRVKSCFKKVDRKISRLNKHLDMAKGKIKRIK